jgi:hypothetical protein
MFSILPCLLSSIHLISVTMLCIFPQLVSAPNHLSFPIVIYLISCLGISVCGACPYHCVLDFINFPYSVFILRTCLMFCFRVLSLISFLSILCLLTYPLALLLSKSLCHLVTGPHSFILLFPHLFTISCKSFPPCSNLLSLGC